MSAAAAEAEGPEALQSRHPPKGKETNDAIIRSFKAVDSLLRPANTVYAVAGADSNMRNLTSSISAGSEGQAPPAIMKARAAHLLGQAQGGETEIVVGDKDVEGMQERAWLSILRDFDFWVVNQYLVSLDDASKKDWLREHYPEWFERQEDTMRKYREAQKHYQSLTVHGPQNKEDMFFMYVFETELRHMPDLLPGLNPDISSPVDNRARDVDMAFARGMWPRARRMLNTLAALQDVASLEMAGGRVGNRTGYTDEERRAQINRWASAPGGNFEYNSGEMWPMADARSRKIWEAWAPRDPGPRMEGTAERNVWEGYHNP